MKHFILLALKAKTTQYDNLKNFADSEFDIITRTISNALWQSQKLRQDTAVHIAMNGSNDPPRIISFYPDQLKGIDYDVFSIYKAIQEALPEEKMKLNESLTSKNGIVVTKRSFESLIKEFSKSCKLFYLHKKGIHIKDYDFTDESLCFILGDYIGLPRMTERLLKTLGAEKLSLGKDVLFTSSCPIVVHYVLNN